MKLVENEEKIFKKNKTEGRGEKGEKEILFGIVKFICFMKISPLIQYM